MAIERQRCHLHAEDPLYALGESRRIYQGKWRAAVDLLVSAETVQCTRQLLSYQYEHADIVPDENARFTARGNRKQARSGLLRAPTFMLPCRNRHCGDERAELQQHHIRTTKQLSTAHVSVTLRLCPECRGLREVAITASAKHKPSTTGTVCKPSDLPPTLETWVTYHEPNCRLVRPSPLTGTR